MSLLAHRLRRSTDKPRRYWLLTATAFVDATYFIIGEMELRIGGVDQMPTMTGATTGGVTVSTSHEVVGLEGWQAFDDLLNQSYYQWQVQGRVNPEWIKIDFGAGVSKILTSVAIAPRSVSGASYCATAFIVEWSADNTNWTKVIDQSGLSSGWTAATFRDFAI